jgi:hypothetical protein
VTDRTASSEDAATVRGQIIAAWAGAVYPGDDQICSTYDDEGVTAYFRGRTWQGHEVESLRYHHAGLSFFSAEAFAYYLAAFLIAVLDDASAADVICDSLLFHLAPTQLGRTWSHTYLARLACLSTTQRAAVIAFFDWYAAAGHSDAGIEETIAYLRTGRVAAGTSPLARLLQLAGRADRDPQTIARLSLSNTAVADDDLAALRELPALRELDLKGTGISEAGLAEVGSHGALEVLDLSDCTHLSAEGLAQLRTLTQLVELRIPNSQLDDACLQALAPLQLRRLDVTHARRVTDAGWAALDVSRLARLEMYGVDPGDALLARIGDAGQLRKLTAGFVTDAGMRALARTRLVKLDVRVTGRLTGAGLATLATVSTLRELRLSGPIVDPWPAGWPALERLTLLDVELQSRCAAGLGELPALRELRVYADRVESGALAAASRAPKLEQVTIWSCRTPLALEELGGPLASPTLQTLWVYDASVTAAGVGALAQLPSLTRLELQSLAVDDAAMCALASVGMHELSLEDIPVSDAVLAALSSCPRLRQLRLIRSKVTPDAIAAFRAAHPGIAILEL